MPARLPRSRFFEEFFREFPMSLTVQPLHGDPLPSPEKIRIDLKENGANLTVNAEIPGVDKQDIHLSVDKDMVTIRAEIKQYDADTEDERILHADR
jgi:HSP20 family protein